MKRMSLKLMLGMIAVALIAGACSPRTQNGGLSGSISIDGSSTVFPVTQAIAELFNEEAPDVDVAVGLSGTGGGFEKFCNGETDISDASRPIRTERDEDDPDTPSEAEACEAEGIEFVELSVAIDGLSVLVHPSNDFVECLTVEELKKVWEPGSTVDNWNDIRPDFPDRPLGRSELYGPGTDSGTFDYFTDEIVGEEGASRDLYSASENDDDLVRGVAGNENALGYFGFAYYEQNQDKLKTVAVDGGEGCVQPTRETINSGEYTPLSRPIFIYVSNQSLDKDEVVAFVDFYLENMNGIIADVGYIEVPAEDLEEEVEEWEAFKA
jgi:phosphate transport system substrate-binding protein